MNVTKRARTCRGLAILMTMLLLTALLSLSASAAETVSQHERVRVGFFAMDQPGPVGGRVRLRGDLQGGGRR